jgi:DNA-binding FadR family transcriptional regulator
VRDILEPLGARLAAERASDAEVQKLRELLQALEAAEPIFDRIAPMHAQIRSMIGEIAGNPALAVFVGALSRHSVESIASRVSPIFDAPAAARAATWKRRLVEAIVARSPGQAEAAMRAELRERMKVFIPLFAENDACQVQLSGSPGDGLSGQPKLGAAVAMIMATEIRRSARSPGEKLGAEPDLLAQYGVSRAVFREAIRILELHGFVRTRRGHAGGLLVWTPDPSYAIGAATEFLRASGMNREHFTTIRQIISSKAAPLAAQRITDEGRERLRRQLDLVLGASGRELVETTQKLHKLVGDLSGNRVLAIFNRVLLDLNMTAGGNVMPDDVNAALHRNSLRLCDAIFAGDDLLAHRRMVEHMRDVAEWTNRGLTVFR